MDEGAGADGDEAAMKGEGPCGTIGVGAGVVAIPSGGGVYPGAAGGGMVADRPTAATLAAEGLTGTPVAPAAAAGAAGRTGKGATTDPCVGPLLGAAGDATPVGAAVFAVPAALGGSLAPQPKQNL